MTLSKNLREFKRIRIPLPVDSYTTHKVLTMDFIEGTKITELSPLTPLDLDGGALAEELFQAYLETSFVGRHIPRRSAPGKCLSNHRPLHRLD